MHPSPNCSGSSMQDQNKCFIITLIFLNLKNVAKL